MNILINHINNKFGLEIPNNAASNILGWVSRDGRLDVVKYLREEFGLTADDARVRDNEALRFASECGHLDVLKYLREEFGLTAEDARADDNMALRWASVNGHLDVVKYLREGFGLTAVDARVRDNEAHRGAFLNDRSKVANYLKKWVNGSEKNEKKIEEEDLLIPKTHRYYEAIKALYELQ